MDDSRIELQYFFLTRFNLLLWRKDKEGEPVRTVEWLEHRFSVFEHYCLPSLKHQVCQDFEWIVLFDSSTPEKYKSRIADYQMECPQLVPVFVEPENGRRFADIFRREIVKRLRARRVISTYLDNDDALNLRFVEDLQRRVSSFEDGTFVYYDDGYQFYTDRKYMMQINYPRNHFVSVVEAGDAATVKGIFGHGRHYYIAKKEGATIEHVKGLPMWCEVVHERNMINDANFLLKTRMVRDEARMIDEFAVDEKVMSGVRAYLFGFMPRYIKTFVRRAKGFLFGRRKW